MNQIDLFADDHAMIGQLIDQLENIPEDELKHRWPQSLAEMLDVISCELERQSIAKSEARLMAAKLAGVIAHYLGGRSTYIPTGTTLKDALRDYAIYNEFDGRNIRELCNKYHLSESHIYGIIRQQRFLIKRRYQRELPFEG